MRAFYRAEDHPHGYRYIRLLDGPPEEAPERCAVIGLSTGWIPATVAEDWSPSQLQDTALDGRVLVRLHGRFADAYNSEPEPVRGMYWRVDRRVARPMGSPQPPAELSLLVVRWWDYWNQKNRKSRSHNVANEQMLLDVLEGPGSPQAAFCTAGKYEVHSAFIRNSQDLALVNEALATSMRGRCRAALYFLWPTQRPAVERRLPAAVAEPALLGLMARMEAQGIRSCWPHPSGLYRQLAGKLWVPRVSRERRDLRVPPTLALDIARWKVDPGLAAKEAIEELRRLHEARGDMAEKPAEPFRGVVKLGFSWMGEDVRPFSGVLDLEKVLGQMLDGATQDTVCFLQERIEGVSCEFRLVACRDLASGDGVVTWELVRMRQKQSRFGTPSDNFSMASHESMSAAEAADCAFGGSKVALQTAESEVKRLGELWLQWFRDEGYGTPGPAFRLDFLIATGRGAAAPQIWTVELCECGGSLCSLDHGARTAACLNECLITGEEGGSSAPGFPQPLPPMRSVEEYGVSRRNDATCSRVGAVSSNSVGENVLFKALRFLLARRPVILPILLYCTMMLVRRALRRRVSSLQLKVLPP